MAARNPARAGRPLPRSRVNGVDPRKWGMLLLGFTPLVLLLSRFMLPERLVDNRSGIGILEKVYAWGSSLPSVYEKGDFPARFYHAFYTVFPFMPDSLGAWDAVALAVGMLLTIALFLRFTGRYRQGALQMVVLLTLAVLAGIFIFQVSKDIIQCLIFTLAFAVAASRKMSVKAKITILCGIFIAEGALWRTYYFIMALFVPIAYLIVSKAMAGGMSRGEARKFAVVSIVLALAVMLAFAYVLHAVSPSGYDQIAYQHSEDREDFTATDAASGISSVIALNSGSSPAAFVANWAINVLRLLLPVELLAKSLRYLPFVVYQLAVTWCLVRTIPRMGGGGHAALVVAVLFAFVVTSASFEPDFGSWIRHETAVLPFLVELVGLSGIGTKEKRGAEIVE